MIKIFGLVALLFCGTYANVPSAVFDNNDQEQLFNFVSKQSLSDATSIFQAASVAKVLGKSLPNANSYCDKVNKLSEKDFQQAFHALSASELLNCAEPSVSDILVEKLSDAVESETNVHKLQYAIDLYVKLASKNRFELDEKVIRSVVPRVSELVQKKGLSLEDESDSTEGSYFATSSVYRVLSTAYKTNKLGDNELLSVITVSETVSAILKEMESQQNNPNSVFVSDRSQKSTFEVTSRVVSSFLQLGPVLEQTVSQDQIGRLANYLLSNKNSYTSVSEAYHFVDAVASVSNNVVSVPISAVLEQSVLQQSSSGSSGYLTLSVTDVFGRFAVPFKVVAVRATMRGASAPVLSNQEAYPNSDAADNTKYKFNFFASKPEPGVYDVQYSIAPVGESKFPKLLSATRVVKVSTTAAVGELLVEVGTDPEKSSETVTVQPGARHGSVVRVDASQILSLSLEVKSSTTNKAIKPHQALVRFENTVTNEATYHALSQNGKVLKLSLKLGEKKVAESFGGSGKYLVTVIIADANLMAPTVWEVAEFDLTFPESSSSASKSSVYQPLKEIQHAFRQPEKRPSAAVSSAFTFAVLAPVLVLLVLLFRIGFNLSNLPTSPSGFLSSVLFFGCLVSIVLLLGAYWWGISMFQVLKALGVLGVFTVLIGNRALSEIQDKRLSNSEKQKKA
eukprot:c4283_g1_i1.p1 GENE.c4283_g1_i1~~c4283_g1_i1.p1  ORF type:complete len:679 (-),score=282.79 c4283_g1_i1:69-2105(-)